MSSDASDTFDEDEEMAELFSFGCADSTLEVEGGGGGSASDGGMNDNLTTGGNVSFESLVSSGSNNNNNNNDEGSDIRLRKNTSDSFLQLLNGKEITSTNNNNNNNNPSTNSNSGSSNIPLMSGDEADDILGGLAVISSEGGLGGKALLGIHDKETQDMLDWLDEPDDQEQDTVVFLSDDQPSLLNKTQSPRRQSATTTTTMEQGKVSQNNPEQQQQQQPTIVNLPPIFQTLSEAMQSSEATLNQIRCLAQKTPLEQIALVRTDLYCRLISFNKTEQQIQSSPLADSFQSWIIPKSMRAFWIPQAAKFCIESFQLPPHLASENDLIKLLAFHNNNNNVQNNYNDTTQMDPLIPCVASVLLASGIHVSVASVLLGQMQAHFIPVTALAKEERWEAALALHHALYLLAAYHLPLLVVHLDRYLPGWFGPQINDKDTTTNSEQESSATQRARHWEKQGQIPSSWLLSFLSGNVHGKNLPLKQILRLWDIQLTHVHQKSLRFFLTLAVLERVADSLILTTGQELIQQLQQAFVFDENDPDVQVWFDKEWLSAAETLFAATPITVLEKLQNIEDEAVKLAVKARQERTEAALQARLQAEAIAHHHAQEAKADQARQRLTRARLVAFYRRHAPDKEENIDKILESYTDRLEVLDAKLFQKYGESFQPALKPKRTQAAPLEPKKKTVRSISTNKLLLGLGRRVVSNVSTDSEEEEDIAVDRKDGQVSVLVSASEVLPIVCWTKGNKAPNESSSQLHPPLKYFLVDSRSEEAAAEQGRFPTAVTLSPESMLDPERVTYHEEKLEAFRGAVHIVIMGEGFSAIPSLYKQKLSSNLEAAMVQDESRTNICALFFIKKGFPFVSVLDGGFAAAHAWLVREGPKQNLKASQVLMDYDPQASIFGQMEILQNASATEKAQRQLSSLIEKSLVAMTIQAQQFEKMAAELETNKQRAGVGAGAIRLGAFFKGAAQVSTGPISSKSPQSVSDTDDLQLDHDDDEKQQQGSTQPQFRIRNPFARGKSEDSSDEKSADTASGEPSGTDAASPKKEPSPGRNDDDEAPRAASPPSLKIGVTSSAAANAGLTAASNLLKRNPFRGFGGSVVASTNDSQQKLQKSSVGFASLNNLRKTALQRIRSPDKPLVVDVELSKSSSAEDGFESISFN